MEYDWSRSVTRRRASVCYYNRMKDKWQKRDRERLTSKTQYPMQV